MSSDFTKFSAGMRPLRWRLAAFGLALMAAGGGAGTAGAMGSATPPPATVTVERAAPARPGHAAPAADAAPPDAAPAVELEYLLATEVTPDALLFRRRAVVVFADTPADPAFTAQMVAFEGHAGPLIDRDVVVISDSDPAANSDWRRWLTPHGFSLVVIDKDGQVKQRKPAPWDVRELTRAIDKFPLRRQEIGRMGVMP